MQQNKTKYYVIGIVLISLIIAVIYSFDMKEVWQQKGIYFPALLLICGGILYNSHFVAKAIRALEFTEKYQNKVSGFTKLALTALRERESPRFQSWDESDMLKNLNYFRIYIVSTYESTVC